MRGSRHLLKCKTLALVAEAASVLQIMGDVMDSSIRARAQEFVFSGTVGEVLQLVRDWRAWLPGEVVTSSVGLSRSNVSNEPGWLMPAGMNADIYTTRSMSDLERMNIGAVVSDGENDDARRITMSVSLLRRESRVANPLNVSFGASPKMETRWVFYQRHFGNVTVFVRPQGELTSGRLEFPPVAEPECSQLYADLSRSRVQRSKQTGDDDERYWKEIVKQAEASENVSQYLSQRNISTSTYYDKKKRYSL